MLRSLETIATCLFIGGITLPIIGFIIEALKILPVQGKRIRINTYSIILLISIIAFLVIGIYYTSVDETYINVPFATFIYLWEIIKSTLMVYLKISLIIFILIGLYETGFYIMTHLYKVKVNHYYSIPKCIRNMNSKEIKTYSHLHYEYFVEPIYLNDKELLLTKMAYAEFVRMMNVRKYCK